jgi:hypothetical protein
MPQKDNIGIMDIAPMFSKCTWGKQMGVEWGWEPLKNPKHITETQWCTELRGVGLTPPPPKFQSFDKAEPNSRFCGKYILNNLIRIRISLICKLSGTPELGATTLRSPFSLPSVLN